jgi:hypothetical protein
MTRKSGDRPDANLGLFDFGGRVEEHVREIRTDNRVQ